MILLPIILGLLAGWCPAGWAQLASSPWPMFRHDLRHSGVSPYHDPTPGGTVWSSNIGNGLSSPVIASDGTIYISGSYALCALNSNGSVKWSQPITSSTRSTPAIASDGTVYIGANGRVYAFTSSGGSKWSYTVGGDVTSSAAVGPDGVVYIGCRDGYLYALNTGGTRKWRYNTGDMHMTSPVVSADGSVVYCGGGSNLWAINTATGTRKWSYSLGVGMTSSAALSPDGSTVYLGAYDGNLYAVTADTGSLVWQVQVGFKNAVTSASPAIGPDGTIYLGSNYGSLYAITSDGNQKWIFESKADLTSDRDIRSSVAINADGTVILASYDGYVHAINSSTGTEKWRYLLPGKNYASPAIAADGTIVTATMSGIVYGNLNSTPPTATPPSGLTVSGPTATSAALSWHDNSSDEYGFRIERRIGTVGAYTFLTNVGADVQTYTDTGGTAGLQSGMTYCYRVCAYQAGGLSVYTNEVSIDTPGLMTPTGLDATPISGSQVNLTWTDRSSDELGFKIERSMGPNGLFEEIAQVGANVSFYIDFSPYPAKNYYYRVRAFDATRNSSYSNEDWALTPGKDFSEITHGNTSRKQIALTFDAGTAAIRTGLLSTLKSNNVFSTFFITGYVTEVMGAQVAQIGHDGHLIGNHSYDHPDLRYCADDEIVRQLNVTDDLIYAASGRHTRSFFRAPYGARDQHVMDVAAGNGFQHVNWTMDSGDAGGTTYQQIIDRSIAGASNGAIMLYHCTIANTESAIQTVITELRNRGYDLVTIPELIAPSQVISPPGQLCAGWNFISIPLDPALPFPHIVFRGVPIDHALYRWRGDMENMYQYNALSPESFGNLSADEGYWLWLSSPATITCNGTESTTDRHIKLPAPQTAGGTVSALIGYPFGTAQDFSNCKIYNPNAPEPKTRPVREAMELGWVPNCMFTWEADNQSEYDVSVPEYYPTSTLLEPWHAYMFAGSVPDLELIIPKPQ